QAARAQHQARRPGALSLLRAGGEVGGLPAVGELQADTRRFLGGHVPVRGGPGATAQGNAATGGSQGSPRGRWVSWNGTSSKNPIRRDWQPAEPASRAPRPAVAPPPGQLSLSRACRAPTSVSSPL